MKKQLIDEFMQTFKNALSSAMIAHGRQLGDREHVVLDEFVKQVKANKLDLKKA